MRIDNSAFQNFWKCPSLYRFQSRDGLHRNISYLEFGSKFHEKLEGYYRGVETPNLLAPRPEQEFFETYDTLVHRVVSNPIDLEVETMFEAYKAAYPSEPFEVLECERAFELEIPHSEHNYLGKIDMLVRGKDDKKLKVFETKTESRSSKRNLPQAWAARTQASLYTWAATQLYGEAVDSIILNVCTKASPKGQVGPSFRRDVLERTPEQVKQALRDLIWVADQLEIMQAEGVYPRNTNNCVSEYGWPCDFYSVCHAGGMTPEKLLEFVHVEPFEHLGL